MDPTKALNLADLCPQEVTFELSPHPGKKFTLCRWSLRVRAWVTAKYTSEGLNDIFRNTKILEIADIAFFMLKDTNPPFFISQAAFLDAIVTISDQIALIKALMGTIGIGEIEIKKLDAVIAKNMAAPQPGIEGLVPDPKAKPSPTKKRTGGKSSTR